MAGHRRRAGRRTAFWVIVVAALVAAAVLSGRAIRFPSLRHGRVPGAPEATVEVFFVRTSPGGGATLAAVRRRVPDGSVQQRTQAALRALLDGPTRAERARGLSTEVPSGTALRGLAIAGGTATVDLGVTFAQGGGSMSMLGRVWQVVYTATQFPDAGAAQLLIGGRRVASLGGEGVLIGGPMRRPGKVPSF